MKDRMETVRNINTEQSYYFRTNMKKLIDPFLVVTDENDPEHISIEIAIILDLNENAMLSKLRENNTSALVYSTIIKKVKKVLKENKISKDAPWFRQLEEKMIAFELFIASTDQEMDLAQGERDIEKLIRETEEEIRKNKLH